MHLRTQIPIWLVCLSLGGSLYALEISLSRKEHPGWKKYALKCPTSPAPNANCRLSIWRDSEQLFSKPVEWRRAQQIATRYFAEAHRADKLPKHAASPVLAWQIHSGNQHSEGQASFATLNHRAAIKALEPVLLLEMELSREARP